MSTALLEAPTREYADVPHMMELEVPKGYEFVDGQLEELEVSYLSSYVAGRICRFLGQYVDLAKVGWVSPEGTSFQCFPDDPDKVRRADTAFHRRGRLKRAQANSEGHCSVVPDIVVEVISPNDKPYKVERKRREWLKAGAQLVWLVYPDSETLHAFYADGSSKVFENGDTPTAAPVLPEFTLSLATVFEQPED